MTINFKKNNLFSDCSINEDLITNAYILKFGFINLTLLNPIMKNLFNKQEGHNSISSDAKKEIYTNISASNFVFSIDPPLEPIKTNNNLPDTVIHGTGHVRLHPMNIKLAIPQRKRKEIFDSGYWGKWKPEEFTIYFNGNLFFSISEIKTAPITTDIGLISREFLRQAFKQTTNFNCSIVGPSPAHPAIYFLFLKEEDFKTLNKFTFFRDNDIFIFFPNSLSLDDAARNFISEVSRPLFSFYRNRIIRHELFELVNQFNVLNGQLGIYLGDYFSVNLIKRFVSGTSGTIRKTLSNMHLTLNKITSLKIKYEESGKEAMEELRNNEFLNQLENYFRSDIDEQLINFDLNSHIATMNFAASETSDLALSKATIFASLVGAIIGGLLTILFSMLIM